MKSNTSHFVRLRGARTGSVEPLEARIAPAGAGSLDVAFHGTGTNFTEFFATPLLDEFTAVARQADGKIVAVGTTTDGSIKVVYYPRDIFQDLGIPGFEEGPQLVDTASGSQPDMIVARFNTDGSLDTTFGAGGKVRLDFGGTAESKEEAFAVVMDGTNIIIGGKSELSATDLAAEARDYDVTLVKLDSGGALVSSFGTGGIVRMDFGSKSEDVHDLALVSGKIVAAGTTGNDAFVARFTSTGALDSTFGTAGKTVVDFGGSDQARALTIDASNRIVIAGTDGSKFAVARLSSAGVLDASFGTAGVAKASFFYPSFANDVAVDSQNRVVLAGEVEGAVALVRFTNGGVMDTAFDADGLVTRRFSVANNAIEHAQSLSIGAGDSLLISGTLRSSESTDFLVARFSANGALDTSFGTSGVTVVDFASAGESVGASLVDASGKIVIVGGTDSRTAKDGAVVRLTSTGALDTTWSGDGRATAEFFRGSDATAFTAALLPDGKLLVGGSTRGGYQGADFAMARFNVDGSLDSTFGVNGTLMTDFGGGERIYGIVVQPDGKIVAGGQALLNGGYFDFAVARYDANGTLDPTFGTGGKVTVGRSAGSAESFISMAQQADGKLILAGNAADFVANTSATFLARLNTDGSLDSTFDSDGKMERGFSRHDKIETLLIQPDGRIVVAGGVVDGGDTAPLIARINIDGTVDSSFGAGGFTVSGFPSGTTNIVALQLQPDGSFVAAGSRSFKGNNIGFATLHYSGTGVLDRTWGNGGRRDTLFTQSRADVLSGVNDIAFDATGRILVAGSGGVARFLADGSADIRFGDDAVSAVSIQGAGSNTIGKIVQRPDGTIIAVGYAQRGGNVQAFSVAQLTDDSPTSLNGAFSITTPTRSVFETAGSVTLTVERLGGSAGIVDVPFSTVARTALAGSDFTAQSGTLHFAAGETSKTITVVLTTDNLGEAEEQFRVELGTPTGGGVLDNPRAATITIYAHSGPFGSVDPGFGVDGYAQVNVSTEQGTFISENVADLVVLSSGKFLTIGDSVSNLGEDYILARFNPDGSPDTTFGSNGGVRTDFFGVGDNGLIVVELPDGKLLAGGRVFSLNVPGSGEEMMGFARYTADGKLDRTFGDEGLVTYDRGSFVNGIIVQPDGGFYVSGQLDSINAYYADGLNATGPSYAVVLKFHADGTLDTTFGTNGEVRSPALVHSAGNGPVRMLQQADGKLIIGQSVVGTSESVTDLAVLRLNPNGTLDTTFGAGGKTVLSFDTTSTEEVNEMQFTADGKILIAGVAGNNTFTSLARLTANGQLDTTFNEDGKTTTNAFRGIHDLAVFPNGDFAILGKNGTNRATMRFLADGTPDGTFGVAGISVIGGLSSVSTGSDDGGLVVLPDNSIVSGFSARLAGDTSLDAKVTLVRQSTSPIPSRFSIQSSVEVDENAGSAVITVTRSLNVNGSVLVDFSVAGGTATAGLDFESVGGTLVFADGESEKQIIVPLLDDTLAEGREKFTVTLGNPRGGTVVAATSTVTIFDGAGALSFGAPSYSFNEIGKQVSIPVNRVGGSDGLVETSFTFTSGTASLGADFFGKNGVIKFADRQTSGVVSFFVLNDNLVEGLEDFYVQLTNVSGGATLGANVTATVKVFDTEPFYGNVAGSLDGSFGTGGIFTPSPLPGKAWDVEVQSDGKIVVLGETGGRDSDVIVARFLSDGGLDPTFGIGGLQVIDFGGTDSGRDLEIAPDGTLVFAGWTVRGGVADFAVGRLTAKGALDVTFSADGLATIDFAQQDDRAFSIEVADDGKLVIGGMSGNLLDHDLAVVRLNEDGSLDTTLSADGRATYDFGGRWGFGGAIALQPDGKIILSGSVAKSSANPQLTSFGVDTRVVTARLLANGSLDTTFSSDGFSIGPNDTTGITVYGDDVYVRPNGNIITTSTVFSGGSDFYKYEHKANGSIDESIPANGGATNSVRINFPGTVFAPSDKLFDAVLMPDGSVVYAGTSDGKLTLVKFNGRQNVDVGFGVQGVVQIPSLADAQSIALTPEGDIVVVSGDFHIAKIRGTTTAPAQGIMQVGQLAVQAGEDNGAINISVDRPRENSAGRVTVDFTVVGGSAQAGLDFTAVTGTLVFEESETRKVITVPLIDDAVREEDESFTVLLTGVSGGAELSPFRSTIVTILANDQGTTTRAGDFGGLNFASASEESSFAFISVSREGGSTGTVTVDYATKDGSAKAGEDYVPVFGTLTFGPGVTEQYIFTSVVNDTDIEGDEDFSIEFSNPRGGSTLGSTFVASKVIITDNDDLVISNAGDMDTGFDVDGKVTTNLGTTGPEYLRDIVPLAGGKFLAVGRAGTSSGFGLAKYNADGTLDTTFGTDGKVATDIGVGSEEAYGASVLANGKIVVIGTAQPDQNQRLVLVRYNPNGTLDTTFGTEGIARFDLGGNQQKFTDFAVQPDGKLIAFGTWNNGVGYGTTIDSDIAMVRFTTNGTLDTSFGVGGMVTYDFGLGREIGRDITVQPDGKIVVAGGTTENQRMVFRFNADGTLDTTAGDRGVANVDLKSLIFPGPNGYTDFSAIMGIQAGPDGKLYLAAAVAVLNDGQYVVLPTGGGNGAGLIRLNADLSVDTTFGNGGLALGPRGSFYTPTLAFDADGRVLVADESNTIYRFTAGGLADLSWGDHGMVTVSTFNFGRSFHDIIVQPDGHVIAGGGDRFSATGDFTLARFLGGPDSGEFRLLSKTKRISEDGVKLVVQVQRVNGFDGAASVTVSTADGTAHAGTDYTAVTSTLSWAAFEAGVKTVEIPITDDIDAFGDINFTVNLLNPTNGATLIASRSIETVTIADNEVPGAFSFRVVQTSVGENGGTATIVVDRLNGQSGAVSVNFAVTGGTAALGSDFTVATGTLNFANLQSSASFTVNILNDSLLEGEETIDFTLSSPSAGAILGDVPAARITIVDDEKPQGGVFEFGAARIVAPEAGGGVYVTVFRRDGSAGTATVKVSTAAGSAELYRDFADVSATLTFLEGETAKTFFLPVLDDFLYEGDESFTLSLGTPTGARIGANLTEPSVGAVGTTTVTVTDDDAVSPLLLRGVLEFGVASQSVNEARGFVNLIVNRVGGSDGEIGVDLQLTAGTATAGRDFTATTLHLDFANGEQVKFISVPVRNDLLAEADETFSVALANPVGGAELGSNTNSTITIIDDEGTPLLDFNDDGNLDLLVPKGGKTLLHFGDGNGGFGPGTLFPVLKGAKEFVIGDFTGDGKADVVFLSAAKKSVFLLAGKGDGTFENPRGFIIGKGTRNLVTGDFNDDGRRDLAALQPKGVNVILNYGDGFSLPKTFATGIGANSLVVGDFTEDGRADLLVKNGGKKPGFSVLAATGADSFSAPIFSRTGKATPGIKKGSLIVGDFDSDGHLDITALIAKNRLAFFSGFGNGRIASNDIVALPKGAKLVSVGDFEDDLDLDIITTTPKKTAAVISNTGSGHFIAGSLFPINFTPTKVYVCDINADQDPDFILTNKKDQFAVLLGAGGSTFASPLSTVARIIAGNS